MSSVVVDSLPQKEDVMLLPTGFPHREVHRPGWPAALAVPKHIIRLDIDEAGKAGTHGWQVRHERPWRFFNDKGRPPAQSLQEAVQHLAETYAGPKLKQRKVMGKKNKGLLEQGIRLVKRVKKGRSVAELWVEASPPSKHFSPVRIYAGTENTTSEVRLEMAKLEARKARASMLKAHLATRRF